MSTEEQVALLQSFRPRGQEGFTEAEAEKLMQWARQTQLQYNLLELALSGVIRIGLRDTGEFEFEAAVGPAEAARRLSNLDAGGK